MTPVLRLHLDLAVDAPRQLLLNRLALDARQRQLAREARVRLEDASRYGQLELDRERRGGLRWDGEGKGFGRTESAVTAVEQLGRDVTSVQHKYKGLQIIICMRSHNVTKIVILNIIIITIVCRYRDAPAWLSVCDSYLHGGGACVAAFHLYTTRTACRTVRPEGVRLR